jgi:hypothetical protein
LFWLIYLLFLLVLAESAARAFWKTRGVPFFQTHKSIYLSFYPEVGRVERELRRDDRDCFDILMLGGSVLHKDYGDIEHVLRERLIRATRKCVRIHNLSAAAQTSLDSYYKYRHLSGQSFDLVLIYHGINELRANNCPSSMFRDDYSHLSWYRLINDFEDGLRLRWFVLPYTVKFVILKGVERMGWSSSRPTHRPEPASLDFGCDVKTASPFGRNLEGILRVASERREPVLLMSFALYIPEDYTEKRFENRSLDYTSHMYPVELWGKAPCVAAGIAAHNRVIAELARQTDGVLFVDQDALIPKEGLYFNDACHLTHEGCERFVDSILARILEIM